ncbi:MAG: PHP domain-containing protein [Clostridia bacterium]|nr:PHP domain-containing protein [Clostridia bacterium]
MIDLHIHTKFSDGTDTVENLLEKIIKNKIKIFSITDHDTIDGCSYLLENLKSELTKNNINFITGIEISTNLNNNPIHILAYNFDINNETIHNLIKGNKKLRKFRINKIIDALYNEFGIKLPKKDMDFISSLENPSRSHIAASLVRMGYSDFQSCMTKYLYNTFGQYFLPTELVVKQLKEANILSVIAHPLKGTKTRFLPNDKFIENINFLTDSGIDGLECFYSEYDKSKRDLILKEAKKHNLLISGGSDYHGFNKNIELGCLGLDIETVDLKHITILSKFNLNKINES